MSASSFLIFLFHYTVEHQKSCRATNLQFLEDNSYINLKLFPKQFCTCRLFLNQPKKAYDVVHISLDKIIFQYIMITGKDEENWMAQCC